MSGLDWLLMAVGYLIGSVPFAFVLARRVAGVDLRQAGSGNVGAANALRTTRLSVACAVVALDVAKGGAAVLLAQGVGAAAPIQVAAGTAAVVGHIYPVWLGFAGGKGVATACGAFLVLAPIATVIAGAGFAAIVGLSRYVSMGSTVAALALPWLAYLTGAPRPTVVGAVVVAGLIVYRHRDNLVRLSAGTERRLGA